MKISTVIKTLTFIKEAYGDLPVYVADWSEGYGNPTELTQYTIKNEMVILEERMGSSFLKEDQDSEKKS